MSLFYTSYFSLGEKEEFAYNCTAFSRFSSMFIYREIRTQIMFKKQKYGKLLELSFPPTTSIESSGRNRIVLAGYPPKMVEAGIKMLTEELNYFTLLLGQKKIILLIVLWIYYSCKTRTCVIFTQDEHWVSRTEPHRSRGVLTAEAGDSILKKKSLYSFCFKSYVITLDILKDIYHY